MGWSRPVPSRCSRRAMCPRLARTRCSRKSIRLIYPTARELTSPPVRLPPTNQPALARWCANASGANIGNPNFDFPARSFFDVFVDVTVPGVGSPFINSTPLLINNNAITSFPPVVIYTHGNSTAVPLMFTAGNAFNEPAGTIFGLITLAGHGAGYSNNPAGGAVDQNNGQPADATTFQQTYNQALNNPTDLMPLPQQYSSWSTYVPTAPNTPEPSSFALLAAGIAGLGFAAWRKKHRRA